LIAKLEEKAEDTLSFKLPEHIEIIEKLAKIIQGYPGERVVQL